MANVTGWDKLIDTNVFGAVVDMFQDALSGWAIPLLFFTFQIMLMIKTKSVNLVWVTGFMFVSLYATATFMNMISLQVMFVLLVMELAVVLYSLFFMD